MNWIGSFFWPAGRVSRLGFWLGWIVLLVAPWAVSGVVSAVLAGGPAVPSDSQLGLRTLQGVNLLMLWAHFCLRARRLHDFDGMALWIALPAVLSFILAGVGVLVMFGSFELSLGLWAAALLVWLVFDIVIGFRRSTGADGLPLSRGAAAQPA